MRVRVVTLFPEFFVEPLGVSVLGRACEAGILDVSCLNPRDWATDRHRTVDDTPYGGGAGMVLRAPELAGAVDEARRQAPGPVLLMSPQGEPFRQEHAAFLAGLEGFTVVCGRYEGVDERFVQRRIDAEVSLGDFILSGGEPAALCVVDAVARLLPGALGNAASPEHESFSRPRLEHPQYTRPAEFEGLEVPPVLLGGNHGLVDCWRERVSCLRTVARRPDLVEGEEIAAWGESPLDESIPRELHEARGMSALMARYADAG